MNWIFDFWKIFIRISTGIVTYIFFNFHAFQNYSLANEGSWILFVISLLIWGLLKRFAIALWSLCNVNSLASIVCCVHKLNLCWKISVWSENTVDLLGIMIVRKRIQWKLCSVYILAKITGTGITLQRVLVFQKPRYRFQSNQNLFPFVIILLRDVWVYLNVL